MDSTAPSTAPATATATGPTRDRLLDAFEELLIEGGERSATLEAVATAGGVSKGGLLYHFGSKDALVDGQLARLAERAAKDTENIRTAPAGAIDYLIRTSVSTGSPLDRAFIASARLAQGRHPKAIAVLADIRRGWLATIEEAVGDRDTAHAILLISDGLYGNSALYGAEPETTGEASDASMDKLLAVIGRLLPADR